MSDLYEQPMDKCKEGCSASQPAMSIQFLDIVMSLLIFFGFIFVLIVQYVCF